MASAIEGLEAPRGWFRKGLRNQSRIIGALMMRDLHTRYGRDNIGYLWLFLEPLMLATAVSLIHARTPSHFGGDIKPVPVALIGYCNFMTFRSLVSRSEGVLEANSSLFYHRMISPFDVLLSRALLEQVSTFMAFSVLMGMAMATGIANLPQRPLIYLLGVLAFFLLSFNVSLIVCAITHERHTVGRIIHPMTYIMMPLSGGFFIMGGLPKQVREIFLYIPLAHAFEIMRYGWFKSAKPDYIDVGYLVTWIAVTALLGLLLLSVVRKRIHIG